MRHSIMMRVVGCTDQTAVEATPTATKRTSEHCSTVCTRERRHPPDFGRSKAGATDEIGMQADEFGESAGSATAREMACMLTWKLAVLRQHGCRAVGCRSLQLIFSTAKLQQREQKVP